VTVVPFAIVIVAGVNALPSYEIVCVAGVVVATVDSEVVAVVGAGELAP
jgi:hypothetical protein